MKKILYHIMLSTITLALILFACERDDARPANEAGGEAFVQLVLKLPGAGNGPFSRAISPSPGDENRISEIDVLAFVRNNSDWVYDYSAEFVGTTISETDPNTLVVTATVRTMTQDQRFVILANSADELAEINLIRGETLAGIDRMLICSTGGGEWPANTNGEQNDFVPFPMYTITEPEQITPETENIGSYPMLRMVARIDVTLVLDLDNFELDDAYLFNYKTAGYVSYGNNFSTDDPSFRVTSPAVPDVGNHSGVPPLSPTVIYPANKSIDTRGEIKNSIYTFESEAITSETDKTTKTALVIGGTYNATGNKSYYRIDLKTEEDPVATNISSGILRNHLYKVEIQQVSGEGYSTALSAYIGDARLTANVRSMDLANQNVILDGQYFLNVEINGSGIFYSEGGAESFTVKAETDYIIESQGFRDGIYIDVEYIPAVGQGDDWLVITDTSGAEGGSLREFTIEVDRTKLTNVTSTLVARVSVSAGNMTRVIDISFVNGTSLEG